jgi:Protein of unknown function (DUF3732)
MQILDIILYGTGGKQRILSFDIGKVNIITGDSKTGKTAIIDIVDYCLGSSDFKVAEGVVREYIVWYAIRFQLKQGQLFIARANPTKMRKNATNTFFFQADQITIPTIEELIPNITEDTLLSRLAGIIGIGEYTHKAEQLTRPNTSVTFKHSRFYCFQPQTDIDQRDFLFYNQNKNIWTAQSMKDTLPYFLGVIGEDSVALETSLADKKRNLNRLGRELAEAQSIVEQTITKTYVLINEAKQVGLIPLTISAVDRTEGLNILKALVETDIINLSEEQSVQNDVLIDLQTQLKILSDKKKEVIERINATQDYQKESDGYISESQHQLMRLESVGLFPTNDHLNADLCPLCNHELETPIPTIQQINNSLLRLKKNLNVTQREKPKLKEHLEKLNSNKNEIKQQILVIENSIQSVYKERENALKIKDVNIRKGKVLGKIEQYLESKMEINDFSGTKQKIDKLQSDIDEIETKIRKENKEDKLETVLDQLSLLMTAWSKELEMEFKDRSVKFSVKDLTLYIISIEKKIRFDHTGSGENWVAYHLLIHFALHHFFITNHRPVPNFLMLDQLSQAYFPPSKDLNGTGDVSQSEDDKAIQRLFDFIFKRTNELDNQFQVIVIDHAKLNDVKFLGAIKEEWRNGIKLVPLSWIEI